MNKIIIITPVVLLWACSSIGFDENSTQSVTVENRKDKKSNTQQNSVNTTAATSVVSDPVIEVSKNKTADRIDPNGIFQSYSIYFDLDEYTVNEKFIPLIKKHAEFLAKNSNEFVFVEGHTDERGGTEYNLALGQRRANAVRVLLMQHGANDTQVEAYSYGATKPRVQGSNEEAWAQNRRVDIYYRD